MDRVKTGVPGFDDLVEGGFPQGFNILVTGTPGTGKTIFGLQYLYNGAKNGENGIYVSLDTTRKALLDQGREFGWDLEGLEKSGNIVILEIPLDLPEVNVFSLIEDAVGKIKAKRLVFDSLINFAINVDQFRIPLNYRLDANMASALGNTDAQGRVLYQGKSSQRITYLLIDQLAKLGTTNIVITAGMGSAEQLTIDGVSEYACDGVIIMGIQHIAKKTVRDIRVQKMRDTRQELDSFILVISGEGLIVKREELFEGSKISGITP